MEFYLKKLKYCLIVLVIVVLTQVPFIAMRYLEDKQSPISVGGIIILYLLILLLTLFLAKREGILTFDFSFFSWSSVGLLALYYFLSILIGALGFVVMRLEGGSLIPCNQERIQEAMSEIPQIVMIIATVIGAPVLEEVIFRGFIPKKLFPKHQLVGFVIGAILFGLFHGPTNIGSFIVYGGMGAVFAYVAYTTERLEMSIMAHMLRNGIAIFLMLFVNNQA